MAYVKIKFGRTLLATKADSPGMYTLGNCLTDDITSGSKRIAWILDSRYDTASSNRTFMAKDNGTIIVDDLYADESCDESLSVPTSAMIDLLQQWDEICKINPEEVTIYYENEKFSIEVKLRAQDKKE